MCKTASVAPELLLINPGGWWAIRDGLCLNTWPLLARAAGIGSQLAAMTRSTHQFPTCKDGSNAQQCLVDEINGSELILPDPCPSPYLRGCIP